MFTIKISIRFVASNDLRNVRRRKHTQNCARYCGKISIFHLVPGEFIVSFDRNRKKQNLTS